MNDDLRQVKRQCLADINEHLHEYVNRLNAIDSRLLRYVEDAISNDGAHCNIYEALGIRKELRLLDTYEISPARTQMAIRAIEGVWKDGRHQKGGLKFDTPRGNQHVRLMPYQAWCLFGIYTFTTEVDLERDYTEDEQLLPTEFVRDGGVWDKRRLTTETDLFQTRKSGKTEFGAAIDFIEACFIGPVNAQALICACSKEQAKIAFKAVKEFAYQIDPTCTNRLGGKYLRVTADEINWQPGLRRKGEIKVMSAGGKKKDGLYASIVHVDEHGQEGYTNGHSNIQELADVCAGSMGPRRERLLLHTTTAGLISEGPYKSQLAGVQQTLIEEMNYPLGQPQRTPYDRRFSFLLQLDPWEQDYTLDELDNPELFKKVNRSIGVTVQPTWYRERLQMARQSEDTKKEVLTKDFNLWQTGHMTTWLKSERIRPLQIPYRIENCRYDRGWKIYCGLDFSHGDDLFAITYLALDTTPSNTMHGRFFADTDAWILQSELERSPLRSLYEEWIAAGWLHVCPGEVFDSIYAINTLTAKMFEPDANGRPDLQRPRLNFVMFGYDPAQNRSPINQLKAWLHSWFMSQGQFSDKEIADTIERMVVPVSQTAMVMNPVIGHLEDLVKKSDEWLQFSQNPMWPWQFGNAAKEVNNSNDLSRIVKGGPRNTHKIDSVMALLDALWCMNQAEGKM